MSHVRRGVPEVLSLTFSFFSICSSSLTENLHNIEAHHYANDTQLLYSFYPDEIKPKGFINTDLGELMY